MTRNVFPVVDLSKTFILTIVVCMSLSACSQATEVDKLFEERNTLIEEHRRLKQGDPNKRPSWDEMREQSIAMDMRIEETLKNRGAAVIPALIKRMNSTDGNLCHKILIGFGLDSVAPIIEYARKDGDTTNAGIVLVGIGLPCVEPLYKELKSEKAYMRELACNVLIELAGMRLASDKTNHLPPLNPFPHQTFHVEAIANALDAEQVPSVREKLVVMFGASKHPDAQGKLMELIGNDPDPVVHRQAVCSLISLIPRSDSTCQFLMKQLEADSDTFVKVSILSTFGSVYSDFKPPVAVLHKYAADPVKEVRLEALKTLCCNYGDDKKIQKEMIALLKQNDPEVKGAVKLCVFYLNDRDNHPALDPELNELVYRKKQ